MFLSARKAVSSISRMTSSSHLIFIYGTLLPGECRHHVLRHEQFVSAARTQSLYRLVDCGSYPGLITSESGNGIRGEVWRVQQETLERLDRIEGVAEGLYSRQLVELEFPHLEEPVETYFYQLPIADLPDCGDCWKSYRRSPR
jgi:gamma-glutamylcyclotransferase (GGCT)/AIG2-like uncharacterized protein YtfP